MQNQFAGFKIFESIPKEDESVGGKAYVLAQMLQIGMPVPKGSVLQSAPSEDVFESILSWWSTIGNKPLAVRSSACGEDSEEHSYAGQQQTFLNVETEEKLRESITKCFASTDREASRSYREHFGQAEKIEMNVILQQMVKPLYSGVYFTEDPRGNSDWLIELTEGLGESLVSGQVNPYRISSKSKNIPNDWKEEWTNAVLDAGKKAEQLLGKTVDMEWAVDVDGKFWALQARPITTKQDLQSERIENELKKLESENSPETLWDGQTFSDWTSTMSELTFDLWKYAFSTDGAFPRAMRKLGYLANKSKIKDSLLQRVFGRAYMNLNMLEPLFFGEIPYRLESSPRPHLKFDIRKLSLRIIVNTPAPLWRMIKVGWKLRTHRLQYLERARKSLKDFRKANNTVLNADMFKHLEDDDLFNQWNKEIEIYSTKTMVWPFTLTFLIESTIQSLQIMLQKVEGNKNQAKAELQLWMGLGLNTQNREMNNQLELVQKDSEKLKGFLRIYGHRGPGEMDLANPRWIESPPKILDSSSTKKKKQAETVEERIQRYGRMKGSVILQEWEILKSLLEAREEWKNESLKPYARIRLLTLEIGKRLDLGEDIFWLNKEEIRNCFYYNEKSPEFLKKAKEQKVKINALSKVHLPTVVSLKDLRNQLNKGTELSGNTLNGESLSIGLAFGTAVAMTSPESIPLDELPEEMILIAHSIDPGWTPVFRKAKAVVTENGGVLSHAAIVAREMGIPAVSQLPNAMKQIQTGTPIWVDGTHGRVSIGEENGNTSH